MLITLVLVQGSAEVKAGVAATSLRVSADIFSPVIGWVLKPEGL